MGGLDCMATKDREFEIDLEGGGSNTSEDDLSSETDSTSKTHARKSFSRLRSGFLCSDGSISRSGSFASSSNSTKLVKLGVDDNVELSMDSSDGEKRREFGAFAEKKSAKGKIKNGKVHKPPRPPRGPSLDAADRIFVKEMTELAVKKRATVERIKALKKMKAEKASSFNSSLPALFITLLFFVVIIFQGMGWLNLYIFPHFDTGMAIKNNALIVKTLYRITFKCTKIAKSSQIDIVSKGG